MTQSLSFDTPKGSVSGALDGDGDVVVVLAPGAGAPMSSTFMAEVAGRIAGAGICVVRFNFNYLEEGRRSPDRGAVLEDSYRAVAEQVRDRLSPRRVVVGGKSLGGRIASHIVAAGDPADGLVFLGYPLHPPGRPDRLRDEHLYRISAPMLFVEGTRDPFCPLETLQQVRGRLRVPNDLAVIEGGDHSFKVPRSSGRSNEAALAQAATAVRDWVARL